MSKALSTWYKLFEEQIANVEKSCKEGATAPKLLLHACCASCSSAVLELLEKYFEITIFYYNPNIYPQEEYNRRRDELYNFVKARACKACKSCKLDGAKTCTFCDADDVPVKNCGAENFAHLKEIKIIEKPYNEEEFYDAVKTVKDFATQKERGSRCFACYKLRMARAIEYAFCNNFDFVTTTLSISPHKDADAINQIGEALTKDLCAKAVIAVRDTAIFAERLPGQSPAMTMCKFDNANMCTAQQTAQKRSCTYLYADFKKKNGFARSLELSSEYGLYRQEYCGCVFSKNNKG